MQKTHMKRFHYSQVGSFNNDTVHPWMEEKKDTAYRQVTQTLWWINNMFKQRITCSTRSSVHFINTGLKKTTRTASHLADSNRPLPEPSEPVAAQQGAHCSIRGTSFPCWWSCLVSEPPPMQFPLMKTLGTWSTQIISRYSTMWATFWRLQTLNFQYLDHVAHEE